MISELIARGLCMVGRVVTDFAPVVTRIGQEMNQAGQIWLEHTYRVQEQKRSAAPLQNRAALEEEVRRVVERMIRPRSSGAPVDMRDFGEFFEGMFSGQRRPAGEPKPSKDEPPKEGSAS